MKQKNLLIICITLIIVVAIGAFALIYFSSNDNQVSNNSNNGTNNHTSFTNDDLAKDNVETYSLNYGNMNLIFIEGYGSKEKIGEDTENRPNIYGELTMVEQFKITLANGDWYTLELDRSKLADELIEGKDYHTFSNEEQPVLHYNSGTTGCMYDVRIIDSNNPAKYMTVGFLNSIIRVNN